MAMRIVHDFSNTGISREGKSDSFLLSNGTGGYASLSGNNISKYQGVYFYEDGECYKAIENIAIQGAVEILKNKFTSVVRKRGETEEFFYVPSNLNAFFYELSREQEINILLDCRKQLDFRKWGRFYRVYHKEGVLFVKYRKKSHSNEDKNHNANEYEVYVAIVPDKLDYEKAGRWEKAEYEYDKKRNDESEIYVYNALKIRASRVVFGFGTTEERAVENVIETLNLKSVKEIPNVRTKFVLNDEIHMAYLCAQDALNKLFCYSNNTRGFFAGLPWFNHLWSRDELVAVGGLISVRDYWRAKEILMKYLGLVQEDGRLPNREPSTKTENADSVGWMFKRLYDLLVRLFAKNKLHKFFSEEELHEIKHTLERSVHNIAQNHSEKGLITNRSQETWCDTAHDGRAGMRIEIQAMQLNMYKLLWWLCGILKDSSGKKYARHKEELMRSAVVKKFWNGHYLNDGADDRTIRPNVFLAHYIYPELLPSSKWKECFDNVLPRLFTGFGLSSLDTHDNKFSGKHTGIDDTSYHNGDSWYWLNNIAAICLYRVGKFRYSKHLHGILAGSTRDLLWMGFPGCASEISSAEKQESFGCFNQAWSNSTYIEMIDEMF